MSNEQKPEGIEAPASPADELIQDLQARITDQDAEAVKGGVTNNNQKVSQQLAEKTDQLLRS